MGWFRTISRVRDNSIIILTVLGWTACGPSGNADHFVDLTSYRLNESTLLAYQIEDKNSEQFSIKVALQGDWQQYYQHEPILRWESFSLEGARRLETLPLKVKWQYPSKRKVYQDISRLSVKLKKKHTLLEFNLPKKGFSFDPLSLSELGGRLQLIFPTVNALPTEPELIRTYYSVGHWQPKTLPYQNLEADSKLLELSPFKPAVDLPISLLDASGFSLKDYALRETESIMDEIWGQACGIRIRFVEIQTVSDQTEFKPFPLPVNLSPEILHFMQLTQKMKGLRLVSGMLLSWPDQLTSNNARSLRPSGMALRFDRSHVKYYQVPSGLLDAQNEFVLIQNLSPPTLAHEIGHIILQQGHDPEPKSLMYAVLNGEYQISPDQCRRARKFIHKNY